MSRDVCQGIRAALAVGVSPIVTLSRRARAALQMLAEEIPASPETSFVMSHVDDTPVQTWTFAGTRANRTLARQASVGSSKVRFDALRLQAPVSVFTNRMPDVLALTDDELLAFRDSIKFSDCVPPQLLAETIIARNFEMTNDDSRQ